VTHHLAYGVPTDRLCLTALRGIETRARTVGWTRGRHLKGEEQSRAGENGPKPPGGGQTQQETETCQKHSSDGAEPAREPCPPHKDGLPKRKKLRRPAELGRAHQEHG
jgi:hypothetical protein